MGKTLQQINDEHEICELLDCLKNNLTEQEKLDLGKKIQTKMLIYQRHYNINFPISSYKNR